MLAPRLGARRPVFKVIAWLLTPVVAWAVALCTAWIGARIGRNATTLIGGASWLGGGAIVGAVIGVVGWVWVVRWWFAPEDGAEGRDAS